MISLISSSDVSPKFLLASSCGSVTRVRSPSVRMFIFFRQLRLRTDSSKSVTGISSTWRNGLARLLLLRVVVLRQRRLGVLEEQPGPVVGRVGLEQPARSTRPPCRTSRCPRRGRRGCSARPRGPAGTSGSARSSRWPRRRCRPGRWRSRAGTGRRCGRVELDGPLQALDRLDPVALGLGDAGELEVVLGAVACSAPSSLPRIAWASLSSPLLRWMPARWSWTCGAV